MILKSAEGGVNRTLNMSVLPINNVQKSFRIPVIYRKLLQETTPISDYRSVNKNEPKYLQNNDWSTVTGNVELIDAQGAHVS